MTKQEKQLLLIDLSARLPYGVQYKDAHGYKKTLDIWSPEFHTALNTILYDGKPSLYLRPMSSMTKAEKEEERKLWDIVTTTRNDLHYLYTDFLLLNHIDFRGLIPMGLALEALEGMYK